MTHKEVVKKVRCSTCGAAPGISCESGAGRLRTEPHFERIQTAGSTFLKSMFVRLGFSK
ncbi:MAG: hypothetical protein JWO13_1406 [Acidobacteriales bacterium]|nr:hypothetical protein [Terriglobales bacterium]